MRIAKRWILLAGCLAISACSSRLSGSWADDAGVTRYAFSSNGSVLISVLGSNVNAEYRVDGDKVLISSPQGTVVLTRRGNDLIGPMGLELNRQPDQAD